MAGKYAEAIRAARNAQGMNQAELAERLGVSRNTVAGWETGHSRPDLDTVPALCKVLHLTLSQFFGVRSGIAASERQLLETFRGLEQADQEAIRWQMEALLEKRREQLQQQAAGKIISIFASDLGAAAGFGGPLGEASGEMMYLLKDEMTEKADEVIRVSGRSMEPTFKDGDLLLVQHTESLRPGEIGIFLADGEGYVKEFREDALYSHNPAYVPLRFSEFNDVRCVGRVLGKLTNDQIPSERQIRLAQDAQKGGIGAYLR